MPLAKDWESFRRCLAGFEAAAQHYGFACADGTIAYQVIGPISRREQAPPLWPAPPASVERPALLSLDELPHLVNPKDGFIVTANQRPIHAGEPFYMGCAFIPTARHDRLVERMEKLEKAPLAAFEQSSFDLVSPFARRMTPAIVASLGAAKAADAKWVGEKLGAWDFAMKADAVEPLLYHAVLRELARAAFEPIMGAELAAEYAGRPELSYERLACWLEDPARSAEERTAIVEKAALAAVDLLSNAKALGKDRAQWRWGALHTVTLEGYLHDVTPLLDAGPFAVPGDDDTPFRFGQKVLHQPFKVETVALLRMFADLGDASAIHAIVSSGEQGWPFHPHAKDQLPLWLEGKTIEIPRELERVRATCPEKLVLEPAK
jgi:penicillin amidase